MIDLGYRPFTGDVEPRKSVAEIAFIIDDDVNVPGDAQGSGDGAFTQQESSKSGVPKQTNSSNHPKAVKYE